MTLLDAALDMHAACLSVVPVRPDGTKAPAAFWKQYQTEPATIAQLTEWFGLNNTYDGLGVITGAVSGNLEMLEVEGRAIGLVDQLKAALTDAGYGDLWARMCAGYLEQSPSGGWHWLYRVDGDPSVVRPNTKLARRPGENPGTVDVMIETRGEGGFTVTAPSTGRSHPSGRAWTIIGGSVATIPNLSVEERDALYAVCASLDQMPPIDAPPSRRSSVPGEIQGERPGDQYNAEAAWEDILEPHGWTRGKMFGPDRQGWTRPGKHPRDGISATTGTGAGGNLYVFTTSTELDAEVPYSKFGAYTYLDHGGDWTASTKALRGLGYGREPARLTIAPDPGAHVGPSGAPGAEPVGAHTAQAPTGPPATPVAGPVTNPAGNLAPLPPPPLAIVDERTLIHSDDANALTLIDRFGDVLRHCADRGRWYAWDGTVWAPCPRTSGPAREYAKRVARSMPERNDKDITHKKKALSAVGISAMLTQAATDTRVAVDYSELDAHPWELNTPGGIVDLRTGRLGPPDPTRLHTRLSACAPDTDADPTVWLRFLDVTFGGDQQLIGYMQRLVGYSTVGIVGTHVLPYCYGHGGNGKGAFLETCTGVLHDYATTAPAGFLMAKEFQKHETELARLSGARMVVCSEVNANDRFDEARVKALTGGDSITARFMKEDYFTFTPTHQLWAMGNYQPHVRAGGPSFWRRLRLIPFLHEVPEAEEIENFQGILARDHGPAILAWIIEGAVAYVDGGLRTPDTVRAATQDYAHDQDTVTRFLEEMCHVVTGAGGTHVTTKVGIIRSAYESWCRESGEQPVTAKAFGLTLQRHGIESTRTNTARMYLGLALITREPDDDPNPWVINPENTSHTSPEGEVTNTENTSHTSPEGEVTNTENTSHTSLPGLGDAS